MRRARDISLQGGVGVGPAALAAGAGARVASPERRHHLRYWTDVHLHAGAQPGGAGHRGAAGLPAGRPGGHAGGGPGPPRPRHGSPLERVPLSTGRAVSGCEPQQPQCGWSMSLVRTSAVRSARLPSDQPGLLPDSSLPMVLDHVLDYVLDLPGAPRIEEGLGRRAAFPTQSALILLEVFLTTNLNNQTWFDVYKIF